MSISRDYYKDVLLGVAVGDAVGVPYEFLKREDVLRNPAKNMVGYGTYDLPAGTWSDDASLTFCMAEALTDDFSLNKLATNIINWRYHDFWTARGEVFDVGITTQRAIDRLVAGTRPDLAGDFEVSANGNGSLMRILPLLFLVKDLSATDCFELVRSVSAVTHGHVRSAIACYYYLEFAKRLLNNTDVKRVYMETNTAVAVFLNKTTIAKQEVDVFERLLKGHINELSADSISSTGYVVHTLEASIWCLLNTSSYRDAVLMAVNLGDDTDTTAAVTGGLAALLYGYESIPADWVFKLARNNDIEALAHRLKLKFDQ